MSSMTLAAGRRSLHSLAVHRIAFASHVHPGAVVPALQQLQACYFSSSTTPSKNGGLTIGLVRETYDKWERRTPLCPSHVKDLLTKFGGSRELLSNVLVQPASHRIFTDEEYRMAGATISEDLSDADLILGVKQVEEDKLIPDKSYMFFSHVIKGQHVLDAAYENDS